MELDGEIKTVSWWNTYIKRQKKVYKKELKKDQRKNR